MHFAPVKQKLNQNIPDAESVQLQLSYNYKHFIMHKHNMDELQHLELCEEKIFSLAPCPNR